MSLNPDGSAACDNCGHAEPNDSITEFAKLSDLDGPSVVTLLLCRAQGCAAATLAATPLAAYVARKPALPEETHVDDARARPDDLGDGGPAAPDPSAG